MAYRKQDSTVRQEFRAQAERDRRHRRRSRRRMRKGTAAAWLIFLIMIGVGLGLLVPRAVRRSAGSEAETAAETDTQPDSSEEADSGTVGSGSLGLPLNQLDSSALYEENGLLRCDGAMTGIDVSEHQGTIDWQAVADAGVEFAIIRVGWRGYTSGEISEDSMAAENLRQAQEAGLKVGAYFFSQATTEAEAEEEAEAVLKTLDGMTPDLPVFFDWEWISDEEARTSAMTGSEITACAQAFCSALEAQGLETGVYFNQEVGYRDLALTQLQDRAFWLAEYGSSPGFLFRFDFWQYSCTGTVAGIDGETDLDLWLYE